MAWDTPRALQSYIKICIRIKTGFPVITWQLKDDFMVFFDIWDLLQCKAWDFKDDLNLFENFKVRIKLPFDGKIQWDPKNCEIKG